MCRFTLLILLACLNHSIEAQDVVFDLEVNDYVKVKLKKGTEMYGQLKDITTTSLTINSPTYGTITIDKIKIESIILSVTPSPTYTQYKPKPTFQNPTPNKNFLTETAFGIGEGNIHYQNVMLGGQIFTYGVSDNFSIGGGFELFSVLSNDSPVLVLSPKYVFDSVSDNLHLAVGGNFISVNDGGSSVFAGSLYGLITFGSQINNVTLGISYAFFDGESTETPIVQIGGMTRLSKRLMLVADQVLVSDRYDTAVGGTLALRFLWDRFNIDLGIGTDYQSGAIPVLAGGYIF